MALGDGVTRKLARHLARIELRIAQLEDDLKAASEAAPEGSRAAEIVSEMQEGEMRWEDLVALSIQLGAISEVNGGQRINGHQG